MRALAAAFFVILGSAVLQPLDAHAGLIHQYQLNGSLADDLGGPALVSNGGTLSSTRYNFQANQGLSLSNGLTFDDNYSIEMLFEFDTTTGYRKILDFKEGTSDTGLYNLSGGLVFYNVASSSGGFSPNADVRVVLTRNGTSDVVVGYVDGVQEFSFIDSTSLAVFTAANDLIRFFRDDGATSGGEASAGSVDLIRIYDAPLSAAQVAGLTNPTAAVPEPASLSLAVLGVLAIAVRARRVSPSAKSPRQPV